MPLSVKKEPSDPDTLIREVRKLAEKHGWAPTGSSVDAEGAVVVSFAVPQPVQDEDAQE
jgi:hypothetical protein